MSDLLEICFSILATVVKLHECLRDNDFGHIFPPASLQVPGEVVPPVGPLHEDVLLRDGIEIDFFKGVLQEGRIQRLAFLLELGFLGVLLLAKILDEMLGFGGHVELAGLVRVLEAGDDDVGHARVLVDLVRGLLHGEVEQVPGRPVALRGLRRGEERRVVREVRVRVPATSMGNACFNSKASRRYQ